MLILAGIEIDVIGDGRHRPMLCFVPPNAPGTHYRVETDMATANRLRLVSASEMTRMGQMQEDKPCEPGSSQGRI